jgi:hypothetical protein
MNFRNKCKHNFPKNVIARIQYLQLSNIKLKYFQL